LTARGTLARTAVQLADRHNGLGQHDAEPDHVSIVHSNAVRMSVIANGAGRDPVFTGQKAADLEEAGCVCDDARIASHGSIGPDFDQRRRKCLPVDRVSLTHDCGGLTTGV
jgi:hypothetical protein